MSCKCKRYMRVMWKPRSATLNGTCEVLYYIIVMNFGICDILKYFTLRVEIIAYFIWRAIVICYLSVELFYVSYIQQCWRFAKGLSSVDDISQIWTIVIIFLLHYNFMRTTAVITWVISSSIAVSDISSIQRKHSLYQVQITFLPR